MAMTDEQIRETESANDLLRYAVNYGLCQSRIEAFREAMSIIENDPDICGTWKVLAAICERIADLEALRASRKDNTE